MKKKLLLAAVLVGALSLGSCVDDKESASVTAVRNAKAEQLKGIAAHENAVAAAIELLAQQEAAVKAAEAAYKQAQTDFQNAQTEEARARAAYQVAYYQSLIQKLAIQTEADILDAKTKLLQAQADYEAALISADEATRTNLQSLYAAYTSASKALLEAKQAIAKDQVKLAGLQAGLVNDQEAREMAINAEKRNIANYEQQIAAYKAQIKEYESVASSSEAKVEAQAALAKYQQLQKTATSLNAAQVNASNALGTAFVNLGNSNFYKAAMVVLNNQLVSALPSDDQVQIIGYSSSVDEFGLPVEGTVDTYWFAAFNPKTGKNDHTAVAQNEQTKQEEIDFEKETGINDVIEYNVYTSYYNPIEKGLTAYTDTIQSLINAHEGKAVADAQKAIDEQNKAIAKLKEDKADEADIKAAEAQLPALQAAKTIADNALAEANKALVAIKDAIAKYLSEASNGQGFVDAYNDASKAYAEAQVEYQKAIYASDLQSAVCSALINIAKNEVDVKDLIANAESNIRRYNNYVKNCQESIARLLQGADGSETVEMAIETLENDIANKQAELPILEQNVATTKAALDAATAAQPEE